MAATAAVAVLAGGVDAISIVVAFDVDAAAAVAVAVVFALSIVVVQTGVNWGRSSDLVVFELYALFAPLPPR